MNRNRRTVEVARSIDPSSAGMENRWVDRPRMLSMEVVVMKGIILESVFVAFLQTSSA